MLRKEWLLLCLLLAAACEPTPTRVQTVKPPEAGLRVLVKFAPGRGTKGRDRLSPDLRATVDANARFTGMTREGKAVLEFPLGFDIERARDMLDKAVGVLGRIEEVAAPDILEIDGLVVVYTGAAPPRGTLAGLPIVDQHEPGEFVVVCSRGGFSHGQLRALEDHRNVRYVEPNYRYCLIENIQAQTIPAKKPLEPPNDPYYLEGKLWGLENINAPVAWGKGFTGSEEIIVAVLDTGIKHTHEDLIDNRWENTDELQGTENEDDDNNGYFDDVYGYDFVDPEDKESQPGPLDEHNNGHGTRVAGVIGARGDNGGGVVGVNWRVKLMALRVIDSKSRTGYVDRIVKAIDYAVANGAHVLNNSWEGVRSDRIYDAIARAGDKGRLFVAAAGNNWGADIDDPEHAIYPACYDLKNIITVLSIKERDKLSLQSNIGENSVDIGAPGVDISSTSRELKPWPYSDRSGTSLAAAYVSGAAALVWGALERTNKDKVTYKEVKEHLLDDDNVRKLPGLQGMCSTGGTLDLEFVKDLRDKRPKAEIRQAPASDP